MVSWTAPASNGGAAITSYTVTSSGGQTCTTANGTTTTCTVTGLTNGTSYTFTVTATNPAGTSAASAPSSSITPATLPGAPTLVCGQLKPKQCLGGDVDRSGHPTVGCPSPATRSPPARAG